MITPIRKKTVPLPAQPQRPAYAPADGFTVYDPASNLVPRPDLTDFRLKSCYSCKKPDVFIVFQKDFQGAFQYRARCKACGNTSGVIAYAKDVESIGATRMPFGKHKGKTLAEIHYEDPDYPTWCLNNLDDIKLLGTLVLYLRLAADDQA